MGIKAWAIKQLTGVSAEGVATVTDSVGGLAVKLRQAITGEVPPEIMLKVQKIVTEFEGTLIKSVNTTMQAEAKSEHWAQWLWRPVVGFTFSAVIINNYILLPYFQGWGLAPIEIPSGIWQAMLIVLGVAAGTRGLQKWEREKKA